MLYRNFVDARNMACRNTHYKATPLTPAKT